MKVAVIGAGYVGLTTAACLASLGHDVVCADIDVERVRRLSAGDIPIREDGLPQLVAAGLAARRLSFVVGAAKAVVGAELVFLCVPTPQGDDGEADLSYVEVAAREIAPASSASAGAAAAAARSVAAAKESLRMGLIRRAGESACSSRQIAGR